MLERSERLPTFVYIDEANDYFDRNIGIILSQARKYNIGMILAHQFLGQLDSKLYEAIAANTAIKFAGGVSAKDARALAADLRTDPAFIERQSKLSFAAFIKGQYERAVSLAIAPGQMEERGSMTEAEIELVREHMRERYAVHHTELLDAQPNQTVHDDGEAQLSPAPDDDPDTGEPMRW